ncbi:coiled-coil domain-containing protein 97 isoform X2 [Latimeria chalumnae]|uniref:coiled-coil domain-containing protein 97 isoform X2 n=1 Tax=Latimeria chalumnae TaxID=7897 RepID=UPI00313DA92C
MVSAVKTEKHLYNSTSTSAAVTVKTKSENQEAPMLGSAPFLQPSESSETSVTEGNLPCGSMTLEVNECWQDVVCSSQEETGQLMPAGAMDTEELQEGKSTEAAGDAGQQESLSLQSMLNAVANSNIQIKSQQKDEPDLTLPEKLEILQELYRNKPVVFLERFRKVLSEDHLVCFSHLAGNYEVNFYCNEIRRSNLKKVNRTQVRNKRYAALQQLIRGGEYFSDEQMRSRDPLLYEQYIGQYLTDEEIISQSSHEPAETCCLSGLLMRTYQEHVIQLKLQRQQEREEACMEEEEEDEEEDSPGGPEDWVPSNEEKVLLRDEFVSRMHQHFLDGKDGDFDYSEVDDNPDYDNLDIVTRDEEERYFDHDDDDDDDGMEKMEDH